MSWMVLWLAVSTRAPDRHGPDAAGVGGGSPRPRAGRPARFPSSRRTRTPAGCAGTRLRIPGLLGDPRVFEAVFGWGDAAGPPRPGQAVPVSPFLTFAVTVHRSATELASMGHVAERTGPRQRVPLFDAPALRDFLGSPARKLFLAELLASFTRVASGRYRVRGGPDPHPAVQRAGPGPAGRAAGRRARRRAAGGVPPAR